MSKRVLSMVLAVIMVLLLLPTSVGATEDITVYLSVSRYGEFVSDKNGTPMVCVPVTLEGGAEVTLDDVFRTAHRMHYPEGEAGYASSVSEWGLGVDKFWGDTSYNFGYQVNAAREAVMGPGHVVTDGDYIDACIYQNAYPLTEGYSYFNDYRAETLAGREVRLTLTYASGYDENWNTMYSPCQAATILVNGEDSGFVTDESGMVTMTFSEPGTYTISARKAKIVSDASVPAITAPVCILEVKDPAIQIIHNIANAYKTSDLSIAGGNLPWILADMAVYEELYPESEYCLSRKEKNKAVSLLADFAKKAETPGDLAKTILAVRAFGYDAKKIYTTDYIKVNLVEKLETLVRSGADSVTNIYTLPYVILALSGAEREMIDGLLSVAVEKKAEWQDTTYGTDAAAPMILALSYYCENPAVGAAVEEAVTIVKREQREDGLIDGFEGYESASTGLVLCALSAAGQDASQIICGEKSLIDGLLSVANEELNGFPNAFATEQGFRGFLAWRLLTEKNGKKMYDFSDKPTEELNLTGANGCPVKFEITQRAARVFIDGAREQKNRLFDLAAGEYSYVVRADGYYDKNGSFTVTEEDVQDHILKTISLSLVREPVAGGGGGTHTWNEMVEETVKEPEEETKEPEETETLVGSVTEVFSDVSGDAWYHDAVEYVYQNGLFSGTGKEFLPDANMSRAMLVTVLFRLEQPEKADGQTSFADVEDGAWYRDGVLWAASSGIIQGVSETEFAPDAQITREQLSVILYRYAKQKGKVEESADLLSYSDAASISSYAKEAMQ